MAVNRLQSTNGESWRQDTVQTNPWDPPKLARQSNIATMRIINPRRKLSVLRGKSTDHDMKYR
jgi:hypothetical protein